MKDNQLEYYQTPERVIIWIKNMSNNTEFFKNIEVIPFGNMAFIYPKNMDKKKAITYLKKYWDVHIEGETE